MTTELNQPHGTVTASGTVVSGSASLPFAGNNFGTCTNPANANDGSDATVAVFPNDTSSSSGGGTVEQYLASDLGSAYVITTIGLKSDNNGTPNNADRVEYSANGSSWTNAPGSWSGSGASMHTFTLTTPTTARYWRLVFVSTVANGLAYWPWHKIYTWNINGSDPVVADFSGDPLEGDAPLSVDFTDESTGSPTAWSWTFGDGGTSTSQNPTHIYANPGTYTVVLTASKTGSSDTETKTAYVLVHSGPTAWDVFAAEDPNGDLIATLSNAFGRQFRKERNGPGSGKFSINRHAPEATLNVLRKGNLVKVRIPEYGPDYVGAFWIESGDFDLLSTDEEGGEILTFGGRGALAYLDRAIMWNEAFTTGVDTSQTWTQIWESSAISKPSGAAYFPSESGFVYVIDQTSRKLYKITQADQSATYINGPLFPFNAAGLSADPDDATIYWALEAPWLTGSATHTKIHKVRHSDDVILDTFDIGTGHYAGIRSDGNDLWLPNQTDNKVYRKSQADGSTISSFGPFVYPGTAITLTTPTGVSFNDANQELAYWFLGRKFALIADLAAPGTITRIIETQDIQAFGGDWTTEGSDEFFYMVSVALSRVWKYQLTATVPHDPVDGIWRLDEATAGAIMARLMAEWQAVARPQHPIPDATYAFDYTHDTDADPWDAHDGTLEFTAQIGESGLDVVLRLIGYGLVLQMSPYLVLGAYNAFGTDRTSGTFASGKVRFEAGVNIAEGLKRQMAATRLDSHMLAQGDAGLYATAEDDDLGYTHEGFISTQLTDAAALEGTAAAELARERDLSEALSLVPNWGDAPLVGRYLPFVHYDVGDLARLHSGSGELDYDEQDVTIFAITVSEQENGEWLPVVDVAEGLDEGSSSPGGGGSSGGSGGGSGVGGAPASPSSTAVTLVGSAGEEVIASRITSSDWGVAEIAAKVAQVFIKWPSLGRLSDVNLLGLADGQMIIWDEDAGEWVPVTLPPIPETAADLPVADSGGFYAATEAEAAFAELGPVASQAEMEAGTEAALRRVSPLRVAQAIAALAGGGSPLTIKDEGSSLATAATSIDFVGAGVTASGTGAAKTVTIPGGSGASGGTPAVVLGTAAAAGSAGTFLRDDDTIVAFDATVPSTQAFGDAAATGSVAKAARRDHKHAMPANPLGIVLPADVPGLWTWLDAGKLTGYSDADAVAVWPNAVRGNPDFYAAGVSSPVYKTNIVNGLPVLRLSGANYFTLTCGAVLAEELSIYVVFKLSAISNAYTGVVGFGGTVTDRGGIFVKSNGKSAVYPGSGTNYDGAGAITYGTTNWNYLSAVFLRAGYNTRRNAVADKSGTAWAVGNFSTDTKLLLGNQQVGSRVMSGDIAELLIYSRGLGSTENAAVEAYIAAKYAL